MARIPVGQLIGKHFDKLETAHVDERHFFSMPIASSGPVREKASGVY